MKEQPLCCDGCDPDQEHRGVMPEARLSLDCREYFFCTPSCLFDWMLRQDGINKVQEGEYPPSKVQICPYCQGAGTVYAGEPAQ